MGVQYLLKSSEIWKFFKDNPNRMAKEMVAVATNEETNYIIYLSCDTLGRAVLEVYKGDAFIDDVVLLNEEQAAERFLNLSAKYLHPLEVGSGAEVSSPECAEEDSDLSDIEKQDVVYQREDELLMALVQFLEVVAEDFVYDEAIEAGVLSSILDEFCEIVSGGWGYRVFRPTFIESSSGDRYYVEYPHDIETDAEE